MSLSLVGTLALMDKMYAPYLYTTIDLGLFDMLVQMDVPAIGEYIAEKSVEAFDRVSQDIESALAGNGGGYYLVFLLLLMVTAGCFLWDLYRKKACFWKGCALAFSLIVFLALLLMYPIQAPRHTLVLDILLLATLVYENMYAAMGAAVVIGALTAAGMLLLALPSDGYDMPGPNTKIAAEVDALHATLTESQQAVDGGDPWDRTLAYSIGNRYNARVGMLYAVPEGMGIQFDGEDYLSNTENEIRSRYIMTISGGPVEQRLIDEGWRSLYEGEECVVYERS